MTTHKKNKIAVVKLGGNVLSDKQALASLATQVTTVQEAGFAVVLIHGGGMQIDTALKATGIKPTKVNGLRVTDAATMEIVQSTLDEINTQLAEQLIQLGINVVQFQSSSHLLKAEPAVVTDNNGDAVSLGQVGNVRNVESQLLQTVVADYANSVPLIVPVAISCSGDSVYYNINADEAAAAVAMALNADMLVFATDVPGVMTDLQNAQTLPVIYDNQLSTLIDAGIVQGGMIPKVKTAIKASAAGVSTVLITNGNEPNYLTQAIHEPAVGGTLVAVT